MAVRSIYIDPMVMAGNPVMARIFTGTDRTDTYKLSKYNAATENYDEVYTGTVYAEGTSVDVDISVFFDHLARIAGAEKYLISLVSGGGQTTSRTFNVYGGGVSKEYQRYLAQNNESIFGAKLDMLHTNFFLTTRTASRIIVIPENELLPLYFYRGEFNKKKFKVFADGAELTSVDLTAQPEALYFIDFAQLRTAHAATSGRLVSAFDIVSDTSYICSVVLAESEKTDMYLHFRNSYGAPEKMAVVGTVNYVPEIATPAETAAFDTQINAFGTKLHEKKIKHMYTAAVSYDDNDARLFILDMLRAEGVELEAYGTRYKVNVAAENQLIYSTNNEPVMITLQISLIDTDNKVTPFVHASAYGTIATASRENIIANNATILS